MTLLHLEQRVCARGRGTAVWLVTRLADALNVRFVICTTNATSDWEDPTP